MRTLVIGDLHLGCGAHPNLFSGARALLVMLDAATASPTRLVLNGDTFDFLSLAAPSGASNEQLMRMFVEDATNRALLAAIGRVLERGGSLLFRVGEHDLALVDRAAQALLKRAISRNDDEALRITFTADDGPTPLVIGDARVVIAHDVYGRDSAADRWLATQLLNPLRRQYGVGLADLLRPNYSEAVAAALAVNPTAARLTFDGAEEVLRSVTRGHGPSSAARLSRVFERAGVTARERELFACALDPRESVEMSPQDLDVLDAVRRKLLRHILAAHGARPDAGPRRLDNAEWSAARRLAERFQASAVVLGHTRSVGWRSEDSLTAVDIGSWTWLLDMPSNVASQDSLEIWQRTSYVDPEVPGAPVRSCWTAALLEPGARARLSLVKWQADGRLTWLRESWLARS